MDDNEPDELEFKDDGDTPESTDTDEPRRKLTKVEFAHKWNMRVEAADRVYKAWVDRFKVEMLYQYFEGFQWFYETDENNRPYVINMIEAAIDTKLPNLLFDNPQFSLRARPVGLKYDEDKANASSQVREDALNFIAARADFGITDKHELAILDSFMGFGVMETGCSDELLWNPNINLSDEPEVLDQVYCKQIPYDMFRVAATANWDLSVGKWYGYYEFIPYTRLNKYKDKIKFVAKPYDDADEVATVDASSGKITVATESNNVIGPAGTAKIWKIWDFEHMKRLVMASSEDAQARDQILEYDDIEFAPLSFLRFKKRRKGWYPYPYIWNWLSPQDEINDSRQAQRLHRKRFSRKYLAKVGAFESEEELDKFLYGPDGTVIKVNTMDAIQAVQDAPLDPVSVNSLGLTYDDFARVSGAADDQRNVAAESSRTTATEAKIVSQSSQIRDSKDSLSVANFMCSIGRNIMRSAREVKKAFWIEAKIPNIDGPMMELKTKTTKWQRITGKMLQDEDYDVDLTVTSVSPINAQQDKTAFMEFLALITQYEILAFSPALLREAAYRCGYKNAGVLNQFQQMAQLAAVGRLAQLKGQVAAGNQQNGVQPSQPGQLPQQQVAASTPPTNEDIMNKIFNRQGVQ